MNRLSMIVLLSLLMVAGAAMHSRTAEASIPTVACTDGSTRSISYGSGYVRFTMKVCVDASLNADPSWPPVMTGERGLCFESVSLTFDGFNELICGSYLGVSSLAFSTRQFCEVTGVEYGYENEWNVGLSYIACARASDVYEALRPPPSLAPPAVAPSSSIGINCSTIGSFINCYDGTTCNVIGSSMFCTTRQGSITCSRTGSFMFCYGSGLGNRSISCSLISNRWSCY